MLNKLNSLKTKMKVVLGMGITLSVIILSVISCTKDSNLMNPDLNPKSSDNSENASKANLAPYGFVYVQGLLGTNQSMYISCTCTPSITLATPNVMLEYGAVTPTTVPVYNSTYSYNLLKNVYYYVVPTGLSYGNNTKCLKVKFKTGTVLPTFIFTPSTNSWSNLQNNPNIEATTVIKSKVPACKNC